MTEFLDVTPGAEIDLDPGGLLPAAKHVFEKRAIYAVNAALAARRPLLVRGEPGTGKSQLARAAAVGLKRAFLSHVVDSHTEARDLCYRLDAVRRLAEAQVQGSLGVSDEPTVRERLAERHFLTPGRLWWTFHWEDAKSQAEHVGARQPQTPAGWVPTDGVVLLLDEMDKADAAVPNGLLEALGNGCFDVPGERGVVEAQHGACPLVIVTTNEERALPDAFLRRCLVLHLELAEGDELIDWLVARGAVHFPDLDPDLARRAASLIVEDREQLKGQGLCPPGQAEYLDLLRALNELPGKVGESAEDILEHISGFVSQKHPRESRW